MVDTPEKLVCTRLHDMTKMHPEQTEGECVNCHQTVGIYPTGQRALARWPSMKIWCTNCAMLDRTLINEYRPAGTADEVLNEMRQSKPVIRQ